MRKNLYKISNEHGIWYVVAGSRGKAIEVFETDLSDKDYLAGEEIPLQIVLVQTDILVEREY